MSKRARLALFLVLLAVLVISGLVAVYFFRPTPAPPPPPPPAPAPRPYSGKAWGHLAPDR